MCIKFEQKFLLVCLLSFICASASFAQNECCVCGDEPEDLCAVGEAFYCREDFGTWFKGEFAKACSSGDSFHMKFVLREGVRRLEVNDAAADWHDYLDASVIELIHQQEKSRTFNLGLKKYVSGTISWIVQSVQALKTWNNFLCCWCGCPKDADSLALDKKIRCSRLWGNPYYERCPFCLTRIERLQGCVRMKCVKCHSNYAARQQLECPLLVCSTGSYNCSSCWLIASCEMGKCVAPCSCGVPHCCCKPKECYGECALLKPRQKLPPPALNDATTVIDPETGIVTGVISL